MEFFTILVWATVILQLGKSLRRLAGCKGRPSLPPKDLSTRSGFSQEAQSPDVCPRIMFLAKLKAFQDSFLQPRSRPKELDPGRFDRSHLGHIDVGRSLSERKRVPCVSRCMQLL